MNYVLQGLFAKDIAHATDLITRSDTTRTALPNRVLYDLVAEFDTVSGTEFRFDTDINGSLNTAANHLATALDSRNMLDLRRGAALYEIVNRHLHETGHADFKPTLPDWPAP